MSMIKRRERYKRNARKAYRYTSSPTWGTFAMRVLAAVVMLGLAIVGLMNNRTSSTAFVVPGAIAALMAASQFKRLTDGTAEAEPPLSKAKPRSSKPKPRSSKGKPRSKGKARR